MFFVGDQPQIHYPPPNAVRRWTHMVFLVFYSRTHSPPAFLVVPHSQQLWPAIHRTASFSINHTRTLHRPIHTRARRWDSNAETFRTSNFDFDSDEDDVFEDDDDTNDWLDILEDFIDGVWIFKAFRSFGWMLPAIISSLLLTSGPKAFLMALAIPMGQSALSLLFQTVWGRPKSRTKRQTKSKRRPPPPPPPRAATDDEEYVKEERKRETGYQTWVDTNGDSSAMKTNTSFGGWEELDGKTKTKTRSNGKRKTSTKSKMSRRDKRSETPMFLRLLIAVFPFLGSWTRML